MDILEEFLELGQRVARFGDKGVALPPRSKHECNSVHGSSGKCHYHDEDVQHHQATLPSAASTVSYLCFVLCYTCF